MDYKENLKRLQETERPEFFAATRSFRSSVLFKTSIAEKRLWRIYKFDSGGEISQALEGWLMDGIEIIVRLSKGSDEYEIFIPKLRSF